MTRFLLVALALGLAVQEAPPVENHARFINRRDLPYDLNLPFRENGFTVVAITFANMGAETVKIDTAKIRVQDPKNKPLATASSSEITPKMVKSGARVPNLSAGTGRPGVYFPGSGRPVSPGVTVGASGGGVVDIGRVERLKAAIEKYQLKSTDVLTGEKVEGYLYLKTDKDPEKLKGTRILLTEEITLAVE
ncbi:MAG: hypothetical protein EHM23_14205 [Acidobacteria bacterium]|nr:MAG: hypothetical protein EHM23_14205 [Acidobacteriota bacterium]